MIPMTFVDLEVMARTIYGEARGESFTGQVAVGNVILNRARRGGWFGASIAAVCQKPWQFSCWNANDPNRDKLLAVDLTSEALRTAVQACLAAVERDLTSGSTHYYAKHIAPPAWAKGLRPAFSEGGHLFFNDVP